MRLRCYVAFASVSACAAFAMGAPGDMSVFTEDFENPNWATAGPWSFTATTGSDFDLLGGPTQFTPADARRGSDVGGNGTNAGGVSVTGSSIVGVDAPTQAILDYTVTVQPNTSYFFEISFESMMYDDATSGGPWRNGMQFHIGNSAQMATAPNNPSPGGFSGPWTGDGGGGDGRVGTQFHAVWGKSWDDTNSFAQTDPWLEHGIPSQGGPDYRGIWHNAAGSGLPTTFTVRGDRDNLGLDGPNPYTAPGDFLPDRTSVIITTGADGNVIFRTGLRLKGGQPNLSQVTFALDNLSLKLTEVPEPASLALLLAGGTLFVSRRRRGQV